LDKPASIASYFPYCRHHTAGIQPYIYSVVRRCCGIWCGVQLARKSRANLAVTLIQLHRDSGTTTTCGRRCSGVGPCVIDVGRYGRGGRQGRVEQGARRGVGAGMRAAEWCACSLSGFPCLLLPLVLILGLRRYEVARQYVCRGTRPIPFHSGPASPLSRLSPSALFLFGVYRDLFKNNNVCVIKEAVVA